MFIAIVQYLLFVEGLPIVKEFFHGRINIVIFAFINVSHTFQVLYSNLKQSQFCNLNCAVSNNTSNVAVRSEK